MNTDSTACTCAYVIVNPLSVKYRKICSVMRQFHNSKVNETKKYDQLFQFENISF